MRPLQQLEQAIVGEYKPKFVEETSFISADSDTTREQQFRKSISDIIKTAQNFSSNEAFWNKLLDLIDQANTAVDNGNWNTAQLLVTQAMVRVNRAVGSEAFGSARFRLALVPLAWFVILYGFQLLVDLLVANTSALGAISSEYFNYMWLGMLGGTTIVWWGLVKHTKDLTFDPAFMIYYILKPPLGAIMGVVVVLAAKAGYVTLNGQSENINTMPLLLLAFIGGFSERFFISLIDKVITALLGGSEPSTGEAAAPQLTRKPPKVPKQV